MGASSSTRGKFRLFAVGGLTNLLSVKSNISSSSLGVPFWKDLLSIKLGEGFLNFFILDCALFFLAICFTCGWYCFANCAANFDVSTVSMSLYSSPVSRMKGVLAISSTFCTCCRFCDFTMEMIEDRNMSRWSLSFIVTSETLKRSESKIELNSRRL